MEIEIPLTKGKVAIVDEADAERVQAFKWYFSDSGSHGYAKGYIQIDGRWGCVLMHRYLLGASRGESVDHINGDGLDNRRCNLRLCTQAENMRNVKRQKGKQFKGVYFRQDRNVFQAYVTASGKRHILGHFVDGSTAARAYDVAASEMHGEFANLNFPGEPLWTSEQIDAGRFERKRASQYRGVWWWEERQKWVAKICVNYRSRTLGYFDAEIDAAKAYNDAAIKYHGDSAKLNQLV